MRYEIISGMLDVDAAGERGGSVMWTEVREQHAYKEKNFKPAIVEVTIDNKRFFKLTQPTPVVIARYEYTISDLCLRRVDLNALLQPYVQSNNALDERAAEDTKQAKVVQQQQRVDNVIIDPMVNEIVTMVINTQPKIVLQVLDGKDKALNSLVGLVIGEIKKRLPTAAVDAFSISVALKQKIYVSSTAP